MSIEDEVRALADGAMQAGRQGRLGMSVADAGVHYQLDAIWDALLVIARKLDSRPDAP